MQVTFQFIIDINTTATLTSMTKTLVVKFEEGARWMAKWVKGGKKRISRYVRFDGKGLNQRGGWGGHDDSLACNSRVALANTDSRSDGIMTRHK